MNIVINLDPKEMAKEACKEAAKAGVKIAVGVACNVAIHLISKSVIKKLDENKVNDVVDVEYVA